MNTLEAFNYLAEKEGRKVFLTSGSHEIYDYKSFVTHDLFLKELQYETNQREFEPIKELKKMKFAEALVQARKKNSLLHSEVANGSYHHDFKMLIFLTDNILLGDWTVAGVYED